MKELIKQRILDALSWSPKVLDDLIFARPDTALHDPFLYTNMDKLITELHNFKIEQDKNPEKLLIVDTDYDTDGIMSAAVLTIPSMEDGYGLNVKAVNDMLKT